MQRWCHKLLQLKWLILINKVREVDCLPHLFLFVKNIRMSIDIIEDIAIMSRMNRILSFKKAGVLAVALLLFGGTLPAQELLKKPDWLPQLSLGVTESYDDNILGVSGQGLQPKGSWVTEVKPGIGVDFAPLLGSASVFQKLLLNYTPDFAIYHEAPAENYDAHTFGTVVKGAADDFSFSLDNSFLYNDGSRVAPTYALNQLSGPLANSFDRYRNQFANTPARERRNQINDHNSSDVQYDFDRAFIRASAYLLLYNMNTYFHNTSKAPYLGYQNYPSRYDVNGGPDFGYHIITNLALTAGYRFGSQYQQQFPTAISSDFHYASSTYQRLLLGLEGNPFHWLTISGAGGPDFRHYNPDAPVPDHSPVKYYGEAAATATITTNHSISVSYRQNAWVASSGYVPEFDSYYGLIYRWRATSRLKLQAAGIIQEADYTIGNDTAGTAPSLRNERLYSVSPSVSYDFTPQLTGTFTYTYLAGNNELDSIPASSHPAYKNFVRQVFALGLSYKF